MATSLNTSVVRYPTQSKPFSAQFRINTRPKSQLAQIIQELRSERPALSVTPEASAASVAINVGLPDILRAVLNEIVRNSTPEAPHVADALVEMIDAGSLQLNSWIPADTDRAAVSCVVRTPITTLDPNALKLAIGGKVTETGDTVIAFRLPFMGNSLATQYLSIRWQDNQLRLSLPFDGGELVTHAATFSGRTASRDVLVDVRADLNVAAGETDGNGIRDLLSQLESMYLRWRIHRQSPRVLRMSFETTSPKVSVTSVIRGLRPEGDNTLSLRVTAAANGTSLQADCGIGRELFGLIVARELLTTGFAPSGNTKVNDPHANLGCNVHTTDQRLPT